MFTLMFFLACIADDENLDNGGAEHMLLERNFDIESVEGYTPTDLNGTISFQSNNDNAEFSFIANCNTIGGSFTLTDDAFVATEISTTQMGCDAGFMDDDNWYSTFLGSSPSLSESEGTLTLSTAEASIVFFEPFEDTEGSGLIGNTWLIDTFFEGDTSFSVNADPPVTLSFEEDDTFTFYDGCAEGGGSFSFDEDILTIFDVNTTALDCSDETLIKASELLLGLFAEELSVSIDGDRITLMGESNGLSAELMD